MSTPSDQVAELAQKYLDLAVSMTGVARSNEGKLDECLKKLEVLHEETTALRHALDAKNTLLALLFEWLNKRGVSVLVGLAAGLGLAGAGAIVQAIFGAAGAPL